jgi:polar amino acid transport system substrate-binding protein
VAARRTFLTFALVGTAALLVALTACSNFPADPDGTLDRVRGGVLRVGVSHKEPWVVALVEAAEPSGIEPQLVQRFASHLQATIEWHPGGEEALITDLEHGRLDLVIGGLTAESPWSDKAAITKPYTEVRNEEGETEKHVMAAPLGENAFLLELEKFLLSQDL